MIAVIAGLAVAVGGFLVMRNPMRLSHLAPGEEGYYQRMVLDQTMRNQMRLLGALICVFGAVILTAGLGGTLRFTFLEKISDGFLLLLWVLFAGSFVAGIVQAVNAAMKGKDLFEWFRVRKTGIELGSIDVFPDITPKMKREATLFTLALVGALFIAAAASLFR